MLIEFSVENFRSIRTRQTLSMVAAPRLRKKQNAIKVSIPGEPNFPSLLKVVAIYGPNASGKSTLIRAVDVVAILCRRKPAVEKSPFPVTPFRFDPELRTKPSVFEVHFLIDRTRYTFELAVSEDRIHHESLIVYRSGVPYTLYSRTLNNGQDSYSFGDLLEGGADLHEAWRKLTGSQTLFIAQSVANSNEELTQLRTPFSWLSGLMVESDGMRSSSRMTQRLIADIPVFGEEVAALLSDVDIPISAINSQVSKSDNSDSGPMPSIQPDVGNSDSENASAVRTFARVKTTLTHRTSLGEANFDFEEESDGTKSLLGFALPWFVFRSGKIGVMRNVLFVDELDSSLHPKLVEALVERHLQSELNNQLIFTTHDTHLMDTKLLRRDQIWTTERDETGATQLRSIHDFEGREGEDLEKRYYEGRYRALPIVKRGTPDGSNS